jgi:hypothetical protein
MTCKLTYYLCGQIIRGKQMGIDMNDFDNELDTILAKNHIPIDSNGLKQAIESTQNDISAAILDGSGERLVELDNRMRVLSARQFGADVSDTKKTIDTAEREKISIAKELEILRLIKKQKNLAAGRAEMLFQKRMEKVGQAQLQIEIATTRLTNARVTAKESKAKLQALLDEKQKETTRQYERYELSRY